MLQRWLPLHCPPARATSLPLLELGTHCRHPVPCTCLDALPPSLAFCNPTVLPGRPFYLHDHNICALFCPLVVYLLCQYPNSFVTPWTVAHQAPLSMGFPRQEYWSGLSFSSPGDLPDPGIETVSPALASRFFIAEPSGKPLFVP